MMGVILLAVMNLDPIKTIWTFGNHEPISMYRRVGRTSTGGIEGGSLWLEDWHRWFDSEACVDMLQGLGLNALHCRFFKGMGWETEKSDFPAVKLFVDRCHSRGILALAYIQFLSLYYETWGNETPDLEDWANRAADGTIGCYHGQYFRWLPCITSRPFEDYLKRMCEIAVKEGGFDGVMFDNVFVGPCYCKRCERLFKEWLSRRSDARERLGFSEYASLRQPRFQKGVLPYGEIQDPLVQLWMDWRVELLNGFFRRIGEYVHGIRKEAIVSANTGAIRSRNSSLLCSRDMTDLAECFDLLVAQNGNAPGVRGECVINRARELKFARALGVLDLSLCDGDAGLEAGDDASYLLPLIEDAAFGGIPMDRTIVKPAREKGFVNADQLAFRRPLMKKFKDFLSGNEKELRSPFYEPVRIFYSARGVRHSETNYRGVFGAEEILLRRHVPFGYVISRNGQPPTIGNDCEVLIVPDQKCLSNMECQMIIERAKSGGRTVITGSDVGGWDDWNRQRFESPLERDLRHCPSVVFSESVLARLGGDCEWTYLVDSPRNHGENLIRAIERSGWRCPYQLLNLPESVFVESRRMDDNSYLISPVNYKPKEKLEKVELCGPARFLGLELNIL